MPRIENTKEPILEFCSYILGLLFIGSLLFSVAVPVAVMYQVAHGHFHVIMVPIAFVSLLYTTIMIGKLATGFWNPWKWHWHIWEYSEDETTRQCIIPYCRKKMEKYHYYPDDSIFESDRQEAWREV